MTAVEKIKVLTGKTDDSLISTQLEQVQAEIAAYLGKEYIADYEAAAVDMAVIRINRMGAEGLTSQAYSGASESYLADYPPSVFRLLDLYKKKWGMV